MRLLLEQPVRMLAETRGMAAFASQTPWLTSLVWGLTDTGDVRLDFDITFDHAVHEAVMVFPDLYPQAPAYVRPRKPSEAWSAHQYPATGVLCLEWGPDNWHTGVTGVDLVQSTFKLLAFETIGPELGIEVPSRHAPTLGQQLRGNACRFLVTSQFRAILMTCSRSSRPVLTVTTLSRTNSLVAMPTKFGSDADEVELSVPKQFTDPLVSFAWTRNGMFVWCDEWASLSTNVKSQVVVREFLKSKGVWPWPDDIDRSIFMVLVDEQLRLRPIALSTGDGNTAFEYQAIEADIDDNNRQPQLNQQIQTKRVALIGLGSVGSKIAVSLARAGVRRFLLIDDDIMLPANLTRNQLDWQSIGMDKVDGVSAAIELVQPDANVDTRTFRFAGQESSAYNTTVLQQVAACDLVIDATANPRVFTAVAAICARKDVALVWGEVFAGGIGGLMARSIPGKDGDPLQVRAAYHSYMATLPEAPFRLAEGYDIDTGEAVYVAGDAEVSYLAASMTQFAIDAMVHGESNRFPVAAYIFGYQKAWVFEAPFDTRAIECPSASIGPIAPGDAAANGSAFGELVAVFSAGKC